MKSIINQNLFKHKNSASNSINNLCTVIHKLDEEGVYVGEVFQEKNYLGNFRIAYKKEFENPQVTIDASMFDPVYYKMLQKANIPKQKELQVGMEGYVVFYVSGHHDGVYFTLKMIDEKKEKEIFDSRRVGKGDMVVFRLLYPGDYLILDEIKKTSTELTVKKVEDDKYPHPSKIKPKSIEVTAKGFKLNRIEVLPLQAIIFSPESECSLKVESKSIAKEKTLE